MGSKLVYPISLPNLNLGYSSQPYVAAEDRVLKAGKEVTHAYILLKMPEKYYCYLENLLQSTIVISPAFMPRGI